VEGIATHDLGTRNVAPLVRGADAASAASLPFVVRAVFREICIESIRASWRIALS